MSSITKHRSSDHRSRKRSRSRSREDLHKKDRKDVEKAYSRSKDYRQSSRSPSTSPKRSHRSRSRERKRSKHKKKDKKSEKSKSKRRSPSTDSPSSDDSDQDRRPVEGMSKKLLEKLEFERKRLLEERKTQKEKMKALETPEEKRVRRLLKKEAKERKRKERMGWDNDYLHYTNADNPFGDANLLETFVWKQKLTKEGKIDLSKEELERQTRLKQLENKQELEKVKKRRQERELERAAREEELALAQRQKEAEQFRTWEKSEDQFHLEQAKLRSKIRIQEGRAKPIDLLAKYVASEEDPEAVEMHEPYVYLTGLTLVDLEDLLEDIKVYMELEKGMNEEYWTDLLVIVEEELRVLRKREHTEYEAAVGRREGVHEAVAKDVADVFKGKTAQQLEALQTSIESKLAKPAPGIDVSYWESLLSQLKAYIARARLRDRHRDNLRKKLEALKAQQGMLQADSDNNTAGPSTSGAGAQEAIGTKTSLDDRETMPNESEAGEEAREEEMEEEEDDDLIAPFLQAYKAGGYSPRLIRPEEEEALGSSVVVRTSEEDAALIAGVRRKLFGGVEDQEFTAPAALEAGFTREEMSFRKEAGKGMDADEAMFSVEAPLDKPQYLWSDKYRPRKPRYFNRVHTGFEWNKYNQTHYDMDNPPPKIVQGYKFNIFYPDLIDKNSTPQYFVIPCADNRDFAILKFHAGPPYEDIAFKVVNREWEYSYKRGFRCQFHNNIFQLWFHFKRYRYRR